MDRKTVRIALACTLALYGLVFILLWAMHGYARAQMVPACYPTLDVDRAYPPRLPYVITRTDGMALYWYCWDGTKWLGTFRSLPASAVPGLLKRTGETSLDVLIAKATKAVTDASDPRAKLNELTAVWADPAGLSCAQSIAAGAADKALCEAVIAAISANFPPSRTLWKVAGTGMQPTYATRGGALVAPANGSVAAGTPCDCTQRVGSYCAVGTNAFARCTQ